MTMNQERLLRDCESEDGVEDEGSESEFDSGSDDSEDDPSFSIRGDSSTKTSHRSTTKKSRNFVNLESESEPEEEEVSVQKLDAKDEKIFELVQKVIEAGQIEKLKVEQCKVYLRKNGLRLTGNKDTLIQRIKEHLEILNGGGEKKYPQSSFVLNCKGDACMGDVVMFEQNVYEMFNLASRSASGPPCGTRIVAGRIVKESYGAAKQQHTFTVEVLWSKGEKPLPPLHPLLIKGRNLYRLRTLRQRWEDEGQRQKALMEKHSRGSLARSDRDTRMEEKKMRKMLKATRISRKPEPKKKQSQPIQSQHQPMAEHPQQHLNSMKLAGASQPFIGLASQSQQSRASQPFIGLSSQSQQSRASQQSSSFANSIKSVTQPHRAGLAVATEHQPRQNNQMRQMDTQQSRASQQSRPQDHMNSQRRQMGDQRMYSSSIHEVHHRTSVDCHPNYNLQQNHIRHQIHGSSPKASHVQPLRSNHNHMNPPQRQGHQPCRHYAQGRCYFGENCKYLHDSKDEYPQR